MQFQNLHEGDTEPQQSAGAPGADTADGERYAVTDLTDRGFILSTAQVCFSELWGAGCTWRSTYRENN